MMASRRLWLVAGLLAGGGLAWTALAAGGASPDTVAQPGGPAAATSPSAEPLAPSAAARGEAAPDTEPQAPGPRAAMVLPDGSRLPALNGVREDCELLWPDGHPWSPVVRKRIDPTGTQWYVHADGTQSTTQLVHRSDLGRKVGMAIVARPLAPQPMQSAEAEEAAARSR